MEIASPSGQKDRCTTPGNYSSPGCIIAAHRTPVVDHHLTSRWRREKSAALVRVVHSPISRRDDVEENLWETLGLLVRAARTRFLRSKQGIAWLSLT